VAYATYKVDDSLTRNYLVFLLLMLGLVMLVALLLLELRPIFDRLMNAAFDKLGPQRNYRFQIDIATNCHQNARDSRSERIASGTCEQPEVQKLFQSDAVQKLFEKTTMVTVEHPMVDSGSHSAADDAGVSLPPETHSDSESATPEIRVFDSLADLPHRTSE